MNIAKIKKQAEQRNHQSKHGGKLKLVGKGKPVGCCTAPDDIEKVRRDGENQHKASVFIQVVFMFCQRFFKSKNSTIFQFMV